MLGRALPLPSTMPFSKKVSVAVTSMARVGADSTAGVSSVSGCPSNATESPSVPAAAVPAMRVSPDRYC